MPSALEPSWGFDAVGGVNLLSSSAFGASQVRPTCQLLITIGFRLIRSGESVADRDLVLSEGDRSVWCMTTTVETAGGQTLTPLSAAVDSLLAADLGRLSRRVL